MIVADSIAQPPPLPRLSAKPSRAAAKQMTPRQLSPEELGLLAEQMLATTDLAEKARLRQALTKGFYGDE